MPDATSFTNEHSCEFMLVPDITAAISPFFGRVIPSYFWSNREGGRMARQSIGDAKTRVLTAYARRPKVRRAGDDEIVMTVNPELYAVAARGAALGCPVLVGVPVVNSLADLAVGASCRWFKLCVDFGADEMVEDIRLSAHTGDPLEATPCLSPLAATDLAAIAYETRATAWAETVNQMRVLRGREEGAWGWWGRPRYQPFHLLLID